MIVQGDYSTDGYCGLQRLVPPLIVHELLAHIKLDIDRSLEPEKLVQHSLVIGRPALEIYGPQYKPFLFLLCGLTPTISELTACDLLPTYTYFRVYRRGDVCRVHSDRAACEHSLSLTLGYSDGKPWPLEVARPLVTHPRDSLEEDFGDEPHTSVPMLRPGDAVLYRGNDHRHGRTTPNPNRWSAHLFMHWVDAKGPHRELAFDGRAIRTGADFIFPE